MNTNQLNKSNETPSSNIRKTQVAVLFARGDSCYKGIGGCDVWDFERNALNWPGGMTLIAHPPCRAWGRLRHFARPREGEKDLAIWAVSQVRRWGGVLEHPASSSLWPAAALPYPGQIDAFGGWTFPITQHWFGHRAEKKTYLYICGMVGRDLPEFPIVLGDSVGVVASSKKGRPEISKADREHTPIALARWLVDLAGRCNPVGGLDVSQVDRGAALVSGQTFPKRMLSIDHIHAHVGNGFAGHVL